MSDLVLREDVRGAAVLTLNRPDKLNALNVPLFEALEAHVAALEAHRPGFRLEHPPLPASGEGSRSLIAAAAAGSGVRRRGGRSGCG